VAVAKILIAREKSVAILFFRVLKNLVRYLRTPEMNASVIIYINWYIDVVSVVKKVVSVIMKGR